MHLVLIGYMGSGKSAVGKELAAYMHREFFDLDTLVTLENKISINEIFRQKGEVYFRKEEARVLRDFIGHKEKSVLALGGGTPCYADNLDMLLAHESVRVIYLKTELKDLCERLWKGRAHRPLIAHIDQKHKLEEYIRKHLFERSPYYQKAHLIVETSGRTPDQIARKIVLDLF